MTLKLVLHARNRKVLKSMIISSLFTYWISASTGFLPRFPPGFCPWTSLVTEIPKTPFCCHYCLYDIKFELVKLNFVMLCILNNKCSVYNIHKHHVKSIEPVCTADIKQTYAPAWTVDTLSCHVSE